MHRLAFGIAALGVLAAGCKVAPNGPSLSIRTDQNAVHLEWLPPTRGEYSGFAVERLYEGAGFETIAELSSWNEFVSNEADAPQGTDVAFRVRALPDDGNGRASNVVTFHRNLDRPSLTCAVGCTPWDGSLALAVESGAAVSLERRAVACTGEASAWAALPFFARAGTYVDRDLSGWSDGTVLEYRLTAVHGAERSDPSSARTTPAPPAPPADLAAVATQGGTLVSFQNASRCNVVITVRSQFDAALVGVVPVAPGPGTPGEIVAGAGVDVYAYSAEAQLAGSQAAGDPRSAWTVAPSALELGWNVSLVEATPGTSAVRLPSGQFATAGSSGAYAYGPDGPDRLPWGSWMDEYGVFAADDLGHVHVLERAPPAPSQNDVVVYAEHDGTGWKQTTLSPEVVPGSHLALDLGLDGTLRAAWEGYSSALRFATRRDGTWEIEDLPTFFSNASMFALAADEAGTPYVFAAGSYRSDELWWRGAGGWQREPVPTGALVVFGFVAEPGGKLALLYSEAWSSPDDVMLIERDGSGWGAPQVVPGFTRIAGARLRASRVSARIAAVSGGGAVWIRDSSGAVVRTRFRVGAFDAGFRQDGKLWILEGMSDTAPASGSPEPAVLLEEP